MDELNHLRTMWKVKARRSKELIVGDISYQDNAGTFEGNSHWLFAVGYQFRDALDIMYLVRMADKMQTMEWTQGPILNFSVGDYVHTKNGTRGVMVLYAKPMEWNADKKIMFEGVVTIDIYDETGKSPVKEATKTLSQMEFLELLISGKNLI